MTGWSRGPQAISCRLKTTTPPCNLYGLQVGADAKLFERNRFSINGELKAGIFDDHEHRRKRLTTSRRILVPELIVCLVGLASLDPPYVRSSLILLPKRDGAG